MDRASIHIDLNEFDFLLPRVAAMIYALDMKCVRDCIGFFEFFNLTEQSMKVLLSIATILVRLN